MVTSDRTAESRVCLLSRSTSPGRSFGTCRAAPIGDDSKVDLQSMVRLLGKCSNYYQHQENWERGPIRPVRKSSDRVDRRQ
jgi:hypothetical protein